MKNARSSKRQPKPKPTPQVIDEQPWEKRLPRSKERGNPNIPIRTVLFVEVGGIPSSEVRFLIQKVIGTYAENEHPHYILPVRDGKITLDAVFEETWLDVVHKTCEVNEDGEIVLKGGGREVDVIRRRI